MVNHRPGFSYTSNQDPCGPKGSKQVLSLHRISNNVEWKSTVGQSKFTKEPKNRLDNIPGAEI